MGNSIDIRVITAVISCLCGAIVWLVLWIRKMHERQLKAQQAHSDKYVELTEKVVEAVQDNKTSSDGVKKAVESNTKVMDDLHKSILKSIKPTRK